MNSTLLATSSADTAYSDTSIIICALNAVQKHSELASYPSFERNRVKIINYFFHM